MLFDLEAMKGQLKFLINSLESLTRLLKLKPAENRASKFESRNIVVNDINTGPNAL